MLWPNKKALQRTRLSPRCRTGMPPWGGSSSLDHSAL